MEPQEQRVVVVVEKEEEVVVEEEVALLGREVRRRNKKTDAAAAVTVFSSNGSANGSVAGNESMSHAEAGNGSKHASFREKEEEKEEGAVEDGKLPNSVYFDEDQGKWKCRHCDWTYQIGSPWTVHIQDPKLYSHMLMNVKNLIQQGPCFIVERKGTEPAYGVSEMNYRDVKSPIFETNPGDKELDVSAKNFDIGKNQTTVINQQDGEILLEKLAENDNISSKPVESEIKIDEDVDLIEEIDQEGTDYDVERVLEKQDTHDLYCPNCNSCITRRVILIRKKRKIRNIRCKAKHDKSETVPHFKLDASPQHAANDQGHEAGNVQSNVGATLAGDDYSRDREPDVFRCLSCFSFFIPTGNGFKLFRCFGDGNENENMQNPQETSGVKASWFSSIFTSEKKKTTIEQDDGHVNRKKGGSEPLDRSRVVSSVSEKPTIETDHGSNLATGDEMLADRGLQPHEAKKDGMLPQHGKGDSETSLAGSPFVTEDASVNLQPGGVLSALGSSLIEKSGIKVDDNFNMQLQNELSTQSSHALPTQDASLHSQPVYGGVRESDSSAGPRLAIIGTLISSAQRIAALKSDAGEKLDGTVEKNVKGDHVIVSVETPLLESTVGAGSLPEAGTQMHTGEQRHTESSEAYRWEILKSIVYGGLVESIASSSVVSSAAGAGTATLNIFALGLANLIGGLFILADNLKELRKEHPHGASNQTNEQNRYQELLGRRENFVLHATVVILSYIIFGLVPPLTYGFSFRKSDDKDFKLATAGGVSLACVILLALGKAHTRRPPRSYIKTLLYYISIWVTTSGASYVAGNLIDRLLKELGLFESSSAVAVPFSETNPVETSWASY